MKPVYISLSNIFGTRSASFDFREFPLISIVGKNGAGKSSIPDGFLLALTGEPSPARRIKGQDIVTTGYKEGNVAFVFEENGNTYRVSRRYKRGKSSVTHEAVLEKCTGKIEQEDLDSVSWEGIASGANDVSETVARVLCPWKGMADRLEGKELVKRVTNAILAAMILPQGDVTRIITATPAEKWQILSAVAGLDEGDVLRNGAKVMQDRIAEEMKDAESRIALYSERIAGIPSREAAAEQTAYLGKLRDEYSRRAGKYEKFLSVLETLGEKKELLNKITGLYERSSQELKTKETLLVLKNCVHFSKQRSTLGTERARLEKVADSCVRTKDGLKKQLSSLSEEEGRIVRAMKDLETRNGVSMDDLKKKAVYAETIAELVLLRKDAGATKQDLERAEKDRETASKECDTLGALRDVFSNRETQEKITGGRKILDEAAERLAQIRGQILGELGKWLRDISDGDFADIRRIENGSVSVDSLLSSSLGDLLDRMSASDSLIRTWKERLAEYEQAIRAVPPLSPEAAETEKRYAGKTAAMIEADLAAASKKLTLAEGRIQSLTLSYEKIVARGRELVATVPAEYRKPDADIPGAKAELDRRGAELAGLMKEERSVKEEKFRTERELNRTETDYADALRNLDAVKKEEASAEEGFRKAMGALPEREREIFENQREKLEREVFPEEEDVETLRSRTSELLSRIGYLKDEVSGIETRVAEARESGKIPFSSPEEGKAFIRENREKLEKSISELSVLTTGFDERDRLVEKIARSEEKRKSLLPSFEVARRMYSLSDAKNFLRFALDKTLNMLLSGVNEYLHNSGAVFSCRSEDGIIMLDTPDGTRAVDSASGGEKTLISILLLRQIQRRMKFQELLCIDEGLSMLDTDRIDDVVDLLSGISGQANILVITHDRDVADRFPVRLEVAGGKYLVHEDQGIAAAER